jgi:aldose 1-epimerase
MPITIAPFGTAPCGTPARLFTWTYASGCKIRVSDYGARLLALETPDKNGNIADILLGFDNPEDMFADEAYIGALVGRLAGRTESPVTINGREYTLDVPEGAPSMLHGGRLGWSGRVWKAEPGIFDGTDCLTLTLSSKAGEAGLPGNVEAMVRYRCDSESRLIVDMEAETDAATPINMTQHVYFNLSGNPTRDILGHVFQAYASTYADTDQYLDFVNHILPVAGTPLDFTEPHSFGARIGHDHPSLKFGGGYDLNYFIDGYKPGTLAAMGEVWEPESGRTLAVSGTQPCLQLYTGNMMTGKQRGKNGVIYPVQTGFCLETQHVPNAPKHRPGDVMLRPGERYRHQAIYAFGIRK